MSNRIITPEEMTKSVWEMFERIADEHDLDGEGRAAVLNAISTAMLYEPTFRGTEK